MLLDRIRTAPPGAIRAHCAAVTRVIGIAPFENRRARFRGESAVHEAVPRIWSTWLHCVRSSGHPLPIGIVATALRLSCALVSLAVWEPGAVPVQSMERTKSSDARTLGFIGLANGQPPWNLQKIRRSGCLAGRSRLTFRTRRTLASVTPI